VTKNRELSHCTIFALGSAAPYLQRLRPLHERHLLLWWRIYHQFSWKLLLPSKKATPAVGTEKLQRLLTSAFYSSLLAQGQRHRGAGRVILTLFGPSQCRFVL